MWCSSQKPPKIRTNTGWKNVNIRTNDILQIKVLYALLYIAFSSVGLATKGRTQEAENATFRIRSDKAERINLRDRKVRSQRHTLPANTSTWGIPHWIFASRTLLSLRAWLSGAGPTAPDTLFPSIQPEKTWTLWDTREKDCHKSFLYTNKINHNFHT